MAERTSGVRPGRGAPRSPRSLPHVPLTSSRGEIEDVIAAFAVQAKRLLDHDRLSIYLLTPDGRALERFAVATSPPVPGEREIQPLEQVGLSVVVRTNSPIVSPDFGRDERILGEDDLLIAGAGYHGLVSVPLRIGKEPFGLLNFVSETTGFYDEQDVEVAQQIADQVAVFLQNLRLQRAVRVSIEREAVERERSRVARELHDTALQALSEISVRAAALEQTLDQGSPEEADAATLVGLASKAHDDVRRSLLSLAPSELETHSLVEAITILLDELEEQTSIRGRLVLRGDPSSLDPVVEASVLRIVQEALTNARRHAGASQIVATLEVSDRLSLTVRDDGSGFDPSDDAAGAGFGIRSMRARASAIGGDFIVASSPGTGTEVSVTVPLAHEPNASVAEPGRRMLRILVVDDQPVFREGLGTILESEDDFRVVGFAGTAGEAVAAARVSKPDVILVDLNLPDSRDAAVVEQLMEGLGGPTILMMSALGRLNEVEECVQAGANGFISKTASPEAIVDAIRVASRGATVFDRSVLAQGAAVYRLNSRELEILRLLAAGATNAEIAARVHLASKTVERAVASIVTKLDARNRTHAVARAITLRLLELENV